MLGKYWVCTNTHGMSNAVCQKYLCPNTSCHILQYENQDALPADTPQSSRRHIKLMHQICERYRSAKVWKLREKCKYKGVCPNCMHTALNSMSSAAAAHWIMRETKEKKCAICNVVFVSTTEETSLCSSGWIIRTKMVSGTVRAPERV